MNPSSSTPTPAASRDHVDHDLLLIAAHAAGDTDGVDRERAEAQLARCAECAALHADLISIAAATRILPAPVRTRDFRLSPEAASGASRRGLRSLDRLFGAPGLGWGRPLAGALTTLGLAGLLVSAAPVLSLAFGTGDAPVLSTVGSSAGAAPQAEGGSAAAAPSSAAANDGARAAASAASTAAPAAPVAGVAAPGPTQPAAVALPAASSASSAADTSKGRTEAKPGGSAFASEGPPPSPVPAWVPWLAAGSTLVLIAGLSLFAIRRQVDRWM
jgi:hypothetical protein